MDFHPVNTHCPMSDKCGIYFGLSLAIRHTEAELERLKDQLEDHLCKAGQENHIP